MKKYISISIFIGCIFIMSNIIASASTLKGKISGFVMNKKTGQPIPDANIIILGTNWGTASQDGGYYFIDNIPQGKYDIEARVIGYHNKTEKEIQIGENTALNFLLEQKPIEIDPIIVTATLFDHLQSKVTVSSEVLTLPRIQEQNGNTVGEVIESVGSIYIRSYDGFAGPQIASIRGSNTDQVLVLMDDLRLNTAQGGGVDLNTFPLAMLHRIEVLRGGHSALSGSDAVGGVIHLISKDVISPKGFNYGFNVTLGSFGTQNFDVYGAHRIGVISYFFNYNRIQSNGDFKFKLAENSKERKRENNDFKGNNFILKTKMDLGSRNQFQLLYQSFQTERGVIGSITLPSPKARRDEERRLLSLQSENQMTNRVRLKGQLYSQTFNNHYKDPEGWTPTDDFHENQALGLNFQGQFKITRNLNLTSGTEFRQDKLESTKFNAKNRNMQSLFAQLETQYSFSFSDLETQWTLIPALRWDNYSDVTYHTSPKLGVLISTGNETNLSLRANWGKSYRVPTFNDLYWPEESYGPGWGGSAGNPNLKPEIGTNFDVGLIFRKDAASFIQVEFSYFSNHINDLINWQEGADKWWKPQNISEAKISGLESSVKFRLPQNLAYLNIFHTWMKAIDRTQNSSTEGKHLPYRPDSKLDIIAGIKVRSVMANLNYRIVSKSYTQKDNLVELSGYELLNGNIRASITIAGFSANIKFQTLNILDKSIYIFDGYPLPGREFRLSFGFNY